VPPRLDECTDYVTPSPTLLVKIDKPQCGTFAFAGSPEKDFEICFRRKDGSMFWAAIFISPVLDKTGGIVQHLASFVDLSKHRQEQDRLRFLLGELNHRTQNTLATIPDQLALVRCPPVVVY
jgi:PAS domain-containing protein